MTLRTCAESSSVGGASLLHLLDENGVHWLQTVPLSPWRKEKRMKMIGQGEEAPVGQTAAERMLSSFSVFQIFCLMQ